MSGLAGTAGKVVGGAKAGVKKLKRGAILGGLGLATVATAAGAASTAKQEASRPLAPPSVRPPGY